MFCPFSTLSFLVFYRFLEALYLLGRLTLCDIIFPFVFVYNLSPAYIFKLSCTQIHQCFMALR